MYELYSIWLARKNKLEYSLQIGLAYHASGPCLTMHLHQRYLLQGLMTEAEWNVQVLPTKFRKYLKFDNTLKIGNVVWLGKYVSPPEPVESDSVSSGSEVLSSESSESGTD